MKFTSKRFRVSTVHWPKREFDAGKKEDLAEYKYFLQKQSWRDGCPFYLDWPFNNMISMIESKIVRHHIEGLLKNKVKTV